MPAAPLRITHVVETLERGGLERVVVDLCVGLRRAGHQVDIVCLFHEGLLGEEARSQGIPVRALGKGRGLDLGALGVLRRHVVDRETQVIHSHNAMAGYYVAATALGGGRRVRINTRHGMGDSAHVSRKERLYRLSLGAYDAVTLVCAAAKEAFVAAGLVPASMATVVKNGIALEKFADCGPSARRIARDALGLRDEDLVIGTVGRLNWAKDHSLLLDAFDRMRHRIGDSTRLVIIGEGAMRAALEGEIRERGLQGLVRLAGDRADVSRLLPAMDVFACSSRTEGYSVAMLEAAAAGLPIVATRVGGNAEIVQDGATGTLTAAGDAEGFASALARLLADPTVRETFGSAARRWARQTAGVDAMVERYVALYRLY